MRFRFVLASLILGAASGAVMTASGHMAARLSSLPARADLAADTSGCFTDTSQADFQANAGAVNCDLTTSPGSVRLSTANGIDQQNTTVTGTVMTFGLLAQTWAGQTFTPAVSGNLTQVDLLIGCAGALCATTPPNIMVGIRATDINGVPTGTDLASGTIVATTGTTPTYRSVTFAPALAVNAGTKYAVVMGVGPTSGMSPSAYTYPCSCSSPDSNPYAAGQRALSGSGGATWSLDANSGGRDIGFKVYVTGGYAATGTFTSSLKDSQAGPGGTATWGTLNWNATVPGGTTLQFQVAASNNPGGPFTYVGPDGTSGTSFTNGASLAQFNGRRYLRYQAQLTSTGASTPVLDDVTICFTTTPQPLVDLDGDDTGDVFTYNSSSGAWKRAIAQGDGTFTDANGMWDPAWTVSPAKFNQDNLTDVFLFNATSGQWFRMVNNGGSGFTAQAMGTWWNGWQRFVMDLNGDGLSDVFLYDPVSGVWFKSFLSGAGADFEYIQGGWNPDWEITPMTLNADAFGDMFLINRTTGRWFLMHGETGGGIEIAATDVWFPGWNLHPGDFNGDGLTDLLLHDPPTGNYFVAMNNGSGTGYTYTSGGWSLGWTPHVGDFDADGDQDLFLHAEATGQWFQMMSDGAGNFSVGGSQTWSLGWDIYPTDLNGDDRTDFLLYHPGTGVWYQARNFSLGNFTYSSGNWDPGLTVFVRFPFM